MCLISYIKLVPIFYKNMGDTPVQAPVPPVLHVVPPGAPMVPPKIRRKKRKICMDFVPCGVR